MANNNKNYNNTSGGSSIGGIITLIVIVLLIALFVGWGSSWYTDWSFTKLTETVSGIFPGADDETPDDGEEDDTQSGSESGGTESGSTESGSASGSTESGSASGSTESGSASGSAESGSASGSTESAAEYSITYVLNGVSSSTDNPDSMTDGETLTLYFYKTNASSALDEVTVTGAALVYYEDVNEASGGSSTFVISTAIYVIISEPSADITVTVNTSTATIK